MAELDSAKFKDVTVSRGVKYHYYSAPAAEGKLTLLFVHGFPSLARDWRKLSLPLEALGYGIVIPDMFGYGGSDKPNDPAQYRFKLLSQDLVDLLDAEDVKKAIAVGHDWGAVVVSRLTNYHPERFHAFVFFALPFHAPDHTVSFGDIVASLHSILGYNPYGYWDFFLEDGTDKVFVDHIESTFSIFYAQNPNVWSEIVCPPGALKAALESDYLPPDGIGSYMSEEDLKIHEEIFRKEGFSGGLCYYKALHHGHHKPDEHGLHVSRHHPPVSAPIFFGVGEDDVLCTPKVGRHTFGHDSFKEHNVTIKEYTGNHWFFMSHAEEIAQDVDAWVSETVAPTVKA